jgi:hypothetical protein
MVGADGVTLIETKVAGVIVRTVEPVMDPRVAVIVVCPFVTLVASPLLGAALLIVAIAGTELFQITDALILRVLPSVYVPVAVSCSVVPNAIEALPGVIEIETRAALVTVRLVDPVTTPELAAMTVEPVPTAVANPVAEIVAAPGCEELQFTTLVKFCVVPSL